MTVTDKLKQAGVEKVGLHVDSRRQKTIDDE